MALTKDQLTQIVQEAATVVRDGLGGQLSTTIDTRDFRTPAFKIVLEELLKEASG